MEELSIGVEVGELFEVTDFVERDKSGRVKYHFVIVDYLARRTGGRLHLNDESSAYGWFARNQVLKLDMSERTKEVVSRCLKSSRQK